MGYIEDFIYRKAFGKLNCTYTLKINKMSTTQTPSKFAFSAVLLLFIVSLAHGQSCTTSTLEDNFYSPSLIITGDFNGDNKDDIFFLDSLSYHLLWKKNNGGNMFGSSTGLIGGVKINHLISGDLNNDGYEEILIATDNQVYYVYYTGPGTYDFFSLYTSPTLHNIKAIALGDFNGDGSAGFVVGSERASTLNVVVDAIVNTSGTLASVNLVNATLGTISDLAVGDITNNGKLDVAMAGYSNLWFKNTTGTAFESYDVISSATGQYGDIVLMDYDNDNQIELVNLNSSGVLKTFTIDPSGNSIYSPSSIISGLPTNSNSFKVVTQDGVDMILICSATEVIALENISGSFNQTLICTGISGLYDVALLQNQNGTSDFIYTEEALTEVNRIESPTKIESIEANELSLYPNPTSGVFSIAGNQNTAAINIQVVNALGQEVKPKTFGRNVFSIANQPTGIYFVLITDDENTIRTYSLVKTD
jgi:hypothetical protein